MHPLLIRLRKAQACGLGHAEILLHYAIGPRHLFIEGRTIQEGWLIQDGKVGGLVHLLMKDAAGTEASSHYRSNKILDLEEDVILTRKGFYRVTVITPAGSGLDWLGHYVRRMKSGLVGCRSWPGMDGAMRGE